MVLTEALIGWRRSSLAHGWLDPRRHAHDRQIGCTGLPACHAACSNLLTERGDILRGHEFRYSTGSAMDRSAQMTLPGTCAEREPKHPMTPEDSSAAIYWQAIYTSILGNAPTLPIDSSPGWWRIRCPNRSVLSFSIPARLLQLQRTTRQP